jgi:hypothetical protein
VNRGIRVTSSDGRSQWLSDPIDGEAATHAVFVTEFEAHRALSVCVSDEWTYEVVSYTGAEGEA